MGKQRNHPSDNRKLSAGEQQLKAANQQLRASEQQLKAANQQLRASEQQLMAANQQLRATTEAETEARRYAECIVDTVREPLVVLDLDLRVISAGRSFYQTFKVTEEESKGQLLYGLGNRQWDIAGLRKLLEEILPKRTTVEGFEVEHDFLTIGRKTMLVNARQLRREKGKAGMILLAIEDITDRKNAEETLQATNQQLEASEQQLRAANQQLQAEVAERKRAEEKIKASLKEKEVLLKEIHHRVKNNMQLISSILNLQSKYIEDKQALKMFKNGQSRIGSMALVHEKLYESEDLANIDFAEYIRSTIRYLFSLHKISEAVRPNIDIEDIFLDVNTAIPCGLIINELVSNALKYAFPGGREGGIYVGLYLDKDDKFTLTIKDNGIGFPEELDFRKTESLGMQLVIMLVEQLEGTIELERKKGTTFTITFEKPKSMDGESIK